LVVVVLAVLAVDLVPVAVIVVLEVIVDVCVSDEPEPVLIRTAEVAAQEPATVPEE
jgi:hypothetical protein